MLRTRLTVLASALLIGTAGAVGAPAETVLYSFDDRPYDGGLPNGLIMDSTGTLYGTTLEGGRHANGTVFSLTPPAAGKTAWTEKLLHDFTGGSDDAYPTGVTLVDDTGAFYGTTGGVGTVFKSTPPVAGKTERTQEVIHSFEGGNDGSYPLPGLVSDEDGAIYGLTETGGASNDGTAFKLTPPASGSTAWTEQILHVFTRVHDGAYPLAGLVRDKTGALYGVTSFGGTKDFGTVFRLTPPTPGTTAWTEQILHSFAGGNDVSAPGSPLVSDDAGALYGSGFVANGMASQVVFKLTPPSTGKTIWTEQILHRFAASSDPYPINFMVLGASGALYGTIGDAAGGVFELTPPAAGHTVWGEKVVFSFDVTDGDEPGNLFVHGGALYGITTFGGAFHEGVAFRLRP